MRTLLTCLALVAAPLAAHAQIAPSTLADAPIVSEASRFMRDYAADLRAGNREGIIARYDRRGVYFPTDAKGFLGFDEVGTIYRGQQWRAPASFEWHGLSYEPLGPDAVSVTGQFVWGLGDGKRMTFAYTGLLVRQDVVLRIRVEHESAISS